MCNTSGRALPSQPGPSAISQQSSVPITSNVRGSLQGDTRVAGKTPSEIWTCNDTQAEHLNRMLAASRRVSAARSAMTVTGEEKYLMLHNFKEHPGKYEHTAQHRELKAALEYDAMTGADDWAHTEEHGHEPYVNKGSCNHFETHNDDGSLITVEGSSAAKENRDSEGGTQDGANTAVLAAGI